MKHIEPIQNKLVTALTVLWYWAKTAWDRHPTTYVDGLANGKEIFNVPQLKVLLPWGSSRRAHQHLPLWISIFCPSIAGWLQLQVISSIFRHVHIDPQATVQSCGLHLQSFSKWLSHLCPGLLDSDSTFTPCFPNSGALSSRSPVQKQFLISNVCPCSICI